MNSKNFSLNSLLFAAINRRVSLISSYSIFSSFLMTVHANDNRRVILIFQNLANRWNSACV